jgi:hypothetical protein
MTIPADVTPRTSRAAALVFWAVLLAGGILRVLFISSSGHHLDSDHGVVYLIARHFTEGNFETFFWGQAYGGTILSWSAGVMMLVFGKSVEVLLVAEILWALAAAWLLRSIVRRAFGAWAGAVAAAVWLFPGFTVFEMSVRDPGFYGPTVALALGVIALATAPIGRHRLLVWLSAGLLAGLALWTSPMSAALAAPALLVLAARDRKPLYWLAGAAVGVAAASPWLVKALVSEKVVAPIGTGTYIVTWDSYVSLFQNLLPAAFPGHLNPLVSTIYAYGSIAAILLLLIVGVLTRRMMPVALGIGTILLSVVLVLGANTALRSDSVRYTIFFVPAFAVAAGWLLSRVRITAWIALLVLPAMTASVVYDRSNQLELNTSARWSADAVSVGDLLIERGVEHAYGNYWLSYQLTAANEETITVAALSGNRRYPLYEDEAAAEPTTTIIVDAGGANDTLLTAGAGLPSAERVVVGGIAVYFFAQQFDVYAQPWALV